MPLPAEEDNDASGCTAGDSDADRDDIFKGTRASLDDDDAEGKAEAFDAAGNDDPAAATDAGEASAAAKRDGQPDGHAAAAAVAAATTTAAVPDGESRTRFEVVGSCGPYVSLVRLFPETGHKHQIRLHCADGLGTPVLGDTVYGTYKKDGGVTRWIRDMLRENLEIPKNTPLDVPLLLHARAVTLPGLGKGGSDLTVEAPVPRAWRTICSAIGLEKWIRPRKAKGKRRWRGKKE